MKPSALKPVESAAPKLNARGLTAVLVAAAKVKEREGGKDKMMKELAIMFPQVVVELRTANEPLAIAALLGKQRIIADMLCWRRQRCGLCEGLGFWSEPREVVEERPVLLPARAQFGGHHVSEKVQGGAGCWSRPAVDAGGRFR